MRKRELNESVQATLKDGTVQVYESVAEAAEGTGLSENSVEAKGNNFELEVATKLKEIGYTGVVSARSQDKRADANKIDLVDMNGELPVNVQCKYMANTPNYFTIRDACTDKDKPFVIVWKKATNNGSNSPGTVAIIDSEYFYHLLELAKLVKAKFPKEMMRVISDFDKK